MKVFQSLNHLGFYVSLRGSLKFKEILANLHSDSSLASSKIELQFLSAALISPFTEFHNWQFIRLGNTNYTSLKVVKLLRYSRETEFLVICNRLNAKFYSGIG